MKNPTRKLLQQSFSAHWGAMLWNAMAATGNGYRRPTLKAGRDNNAIHERADKRGAVDAQPAGQWHGVPKHFRSYAKRYGRA